MSKSSDFFLYQSKSLSTDNVSLSQIAKKTGTPVYVYSAAALLKPLHELQQGLAEIDHLVCFAVKSNSNIAVLKLLASHGAGMDLVSGGELFRAEKAGVSPEKIVFSGVGKTRQEMTTALNTGIYSFNVESLAELHTLSQVAIACKKEARVALRFNPDIDAKTHPYISTGLKKNKFGMTEKEILEIARSAAKGAKDFSGIVFAGISIHIGSQILTLAPLNQAFTRLRKLVDRLGKILPRPITFVDLGGGVGISYHDKEKAPSLKKYCELILKHFGPESGLKVLIEPGRTISGNAGVLISEVLFRKSHDKKDFLIIDAGMNDLVRPALYDSYHEVVPVEKKTQAKLRKVDIVGPVCESSDCFAVDRLLPASLNSGDLVAILSAGAYGLSMSSNYNTRPRPPEVLVQNGKFVVIKKREDYDDLIRGELF